MSHTLSNVIAPMRGRAPGLIAAAWTVVALVAALQTVVSVKLDARNDVIAAVASRLSILPLWAIATPAILGSARRFPVVEPPGRVVTSSLCAHVLLGTAFILLANVAIRVPLLFDPGAGPSALARSTMLGIAEFYPMALIVYGVIVAIGHWRVPRPTDGAAPEIDAGATAVGPGEADAESERLAIAPEDFVPVRQWNRVHLVPTHDIDWIEAEDNYIVVHAAGRRYKGRERIGDVETRLDSRCFVRIHRSTIVHVGRIREVQPLTHGDHAVILRTGKVLRVARSRKQALEEALGVRL